MLASKRTHCRSSTFNVLPRRPVLVLRIPACRNETSFFYSSLPLHLDLATAMRIAQIIGQKIAMGLHAKTPTVDLWMSEMVQQKVSTLCRHLGSGPCKVLTVHLRSSGMCSLLVYGIPRQPGEQAEFQQQCPGACSAGDARLLILHTLQNRTILEAMDLHLGSNYVSRPQGREELVATADHASLCCSTIRVLRMWVVHYADSPRRGESHEAY